MDKKTTVSNNKEMIMDKKTTVAKAFEYAFYKLLDIADTVADAGLITQDEFLELENNGDYLCQCLIPCVGMINAPRFIALDGKYWGDKVTQFVVKKIYDSCCYNEDIDVVDSLESVRDILYKLQSVVKDMPLENGKWLRLSRHIDRRVKVLK